MKTPTLSGKAVSQGTTYSYARPPKPAKMGHTSEELSQKVTFPKVEYEDFYHGYKFNLPLKPPLSEIRRLVVPKDKTERRNLKIDFLKALHFPIQEQRDLERLCDEIRKVKNKHKGGLDNEQPSVWTVTVEGKECTIDIYPTWDHSEGKGKLRHEIIASFPFPKQGALVKGEHISTGFAKKVAYGWLVCKQPKRIVRTVSEFNSSSEMKQVAQTETFYLKLFGNTSGFPEVYKCYETKTDHILLMKEYHLDLYDNIKQLLNSHLRLDDHTKLSLATKILAPIAAMHAKGICHRDIKPENYLVENHESAESDIVLCDFGFSCPATIAGTIPIRGTKECMPWEKLETFYHFTSAENSTPLSPAEHLSGDIWAAGQIFLELFFDLRFPYSVSFDNKSYTKAILEQIQSEMKQLSACEPPEDDKLLHLVWEMLNIAPEKRPSAEAVMQRLISIKNELRARGTYDIDKKDYSPWQA